MSNYCYHCMNEITDDQRVCPHCHKENTPDNVVYRLRPGTILDNKYLVGNCLGEGGFGITYIGRDLSLDIKIAIKEYYPNGYANRNNTIDQNVFATTESQKHYFYKGKDNFLEEARKVAKFLGEPGIVGIREYFEANGTAYIIMEYLEGENLASYIKRNGTFNAEKMFRLMLPITYSLRRIHDAGMIHRDISPDNIMYMSNGSLKLMDFGSARYFTNEQKEMSVLLKQGYAPEEQYRKNGKQGPWTDVYGLCATMYRCITGNIPEDALDRLREDNLIPPSKLGVNIPTAMENILLYGLAVFKENRCQSMDELSSLIEKALDDPQGAAEETANLLPKPQQVPSDQPEQHTYLADDGAMSQNSASKVSYAQPVTTGERSSSSQNLSYATPVRTNNNNYATPVSTNNNSYATPVSTNNNNYATPVSNDNNTNYATPVSSSKQYQNTDYRSQSSYATPVSGAETYGTQTAVVEKPKKKKTGLIIGLIIGGIVVLAAGITLLVVLGLGNGIEALDGTYRMTEMVSDGVDKSQDLNNIIVDLVIKDNIGTIDIGSDHLVWKFDPQSHTITNENNQSIPYRMEGKKMIIENPDGKDRMVFEKQ
ncbi:serine/threonine-protein kinase [Ruminococcus difficilis]|uniref:Protein kinase n=1 Tax=Ruminococcus difficilis TaxID=2763069 RepID=A0A934WRS7_9FIRM|nr:serine/threonine-protein kinase [Ruminococcus difficilis]MBK6088738.1 protein kinase [Ruminococcus difficilis]